MGRANYVILGIGLVTLFILSLFMKHLLQAAEEHKRSPVAEGLLASFGDRLEGKSKISIEESARGPRAVVSIEPVVGLPMHKVAKDVGEYVWKRLGDERGLVTVEVMCRTWSGGAIRIPVAKPEPPPKPKTVAVPPVPGPEPAPAPAANTDRAAPAPDQLPAPAPGEPRDRG